MANFKDAQTPAAKRDEKPKKPMILIKGDGVRPRMIPTTDKALDSLGVNQTRINAYIDSALSVGRPEGEKLMNNFLALMNKTQCFHCMDNGFHSLEVDIPGRAPVVFQWSCECESAVPRANSVMELVRAGMFQFACQLGGPDGSGCPLPVQDSKCSRFHCTKFRGAGHV